MTIKTKYLHSLSIASQTGLKYAYYFKKRAATLEYSPALSINHFYKGYIGKSTKLGNFINTKIVDTPSGMIGFLSTFNETLWLNQQSYTSVITITEGRDIFNPQVNKTPSSIKLLREPQIPSAYYVFLGTNYSFNPQLHYSFQCYEYKAVSGSVLGNYANTAISNINQGEARTRSIRFDFLTTAATGENTNQSMSKGNLTFEIFENSSTLTNQNIYLTSRYPKGAISPTIVANSASIASDIGRFFVFSCVADMPNPSSSDYKEGAGRTELYFGFINLNNQFSMVRFAVTDTQYFYLEQWQANDWEGNYYGQSPSSSGQMLGYLPNILGEPILIAVDNLIYIYVSGVRGHYFDQDDSHTIKAQTAVVKLTLVFDPVNKVILYGGSKTIEHDASGSAANYGDLGGTDSDYWHIYNTLWGGKVGNHAVVLVNDTKHKRFAKSTSNFLGDSVQNEQDIETDFHIYIDDQIYSYSCSELGFYPDLELKDHAPMAINAFDKRYPDIKTPLISKKFGTVISDTEILLCMTSYPDKTKLLLVKFNITNQTFQIIREDQASKGQHVATCYQQATAINKACILYRIGTQGGNGTVYISKDSGATWKQIVDSQYTSGGGMYYLGSQYYSVNYGHAFS